MRRFSRRWMVSARGASDPQETVSMGLDLFRGSPASASRASYAVCIVKGGRIVYEAQDLSLAKVIRLALEHRPRYIVLDNLYEIAASKKDLTRILGFFPYGSQVLLATFDPVKGYRDLRDVAQEHALLDVRRKLDPVEAARILALLGQRGVGYPVRAWEERTRIVISKGRSGRAGGSSEDRYLRSLRTAVLRHARKVKEALDARGISYQLAYRKAEGGLDRAVFIVEAPRERLSGLVRGRRGRLVTISVKPVMKTRIVLPENVERHAKPVIAGVDPGAEYGVAIIDLEGRVLATETIKGGDVYQAISAIMRHGIPVLVASDKKPLPEAVRRVAAAFNARVFEPDYVVSDVEKSALAASAGHTSGSVHERDALAACVMAYRFFSKKLEEADRILNALGLEVPRSKVRVEILRGSSIASAIESAIEELLEKPEGSSRGVELIQRFVRSTIEGESRIRRLEERISELLSERQRLLDKLSELEERLRVLSSEYEHFRRGVKAEVEKERSVAVLSERLRVCQESYRSLESHVDELRSRIRDLVKIIELHGERGLRTIPRLRLPLSSGPLEDLKLSGGLGDLYVAYLESDDAPQREVEALASYLGKILLISRRCGWRSLGDRKSHAVCVEVKEDEIYPLDARSVVMGSGRLQEILKIYHEVRASLPEKAGIGEKDLERILEEYRRSRLL